MTLTSLISWQEEIATCNYDEKVGIRIAKLAGDHQFSTYITFIDPGKEVKPHYHSKGDEHYHILEGCGKMLLKDIASNQEQILHVKSGESFIIPPNTLHHLLNDGNGVLKLMFSCTQSHLNEDRFFI